MLRKFRIILALVCFAGITLLLAGWPLWLYRYLAGLAKIQLLPAIMAGNIVLVAVLLVLTMLFGRVYCSVVCPLGVLQDCVARARKTVCRKHHYSFSPARNYLRYGVLALVIAAMFLGVQVLVATLDPYSAYGRMVNSAAGRGTVGVIVVAVLTLIVVAVLAWRNGRTWCNSICPVGALLSIFSRHSVFAPVIDAGKCRNCHACERKCKAACIDLETHSIDTSRCVACFDCLDSCKFDALKYKVNISSRAPKVEETGDEKAPDASRRAFLTTGALFVGASALNAQKKKVDGGYAAIADKEIPERTTPLTPFGSRSVKDFYSRCTACQLCVAACPNGVLRPSASLEHFMQPEMGYERGYCRPECTKCSQVCPTGAIEAIEAELKPAYKIGTAVVNRGLCVVETRGVSCGNCARHCPAGAILMVPVDKDDPDSLLRPAVSEQQCIGCGACENLCPSRPISAITVDGVSEHLRS